MNEIQVFNFESKEVRTVIIDNEPWWVAKDVCERLDYVWDSNLVIKVPEEWRGAKQIRTLGGVQEMICLSEQGLYFFIARSDKPKALKFQKWIAGEVVPSIRKTGSYFNIPKTLSEALRLAADQAELIEKLEIENKKQENRIGRLVHDNKNYTSTEIAKELNLRSAKELNKILEEKEIQYKMNGTWVLHAKYSGMGFESIKQEELDNGKIIYNRHWTGRGRDFILDQFNLYKLVEKND